MSISPESEAITGYTPEEMIGKMHFFDLHPEEESEEFRRAAMEFFAKKEPFKGYENSAMSKSGDTIWFNTSGIPLVDDLGCLTGYWGTDTDITDRKAAEEALHTANKKLQLLSNITRHDILNKIMALQAYLDLTMHMIDDPTLSGYLTEADKAATAIQKQIEFTKVYENLGVHTPTWQPLSAIIERVDDTWVPIRHDCGDFSVYADPMFENVLHNLYDNTIRHAEGAECVQIRCEERDSDLVITWEDNGPGIPDVRKDRIFDKGFGKNTGLGLFLTREILAITGITIAETGVFGEGARFEILVPGGAWRRSGEGTG